MSAAVKCDICGKLFNSRFLSSHKRRAHPKAGDANAQNRLQTQPQDSEEDLVQQILSLCAQLSPEARKQLLSRLAALAQKTR